jgi:hypothetical protein
MTYKLINLNKFKLIKLQKNMTKKMIFNSFSKHYCNLMNKINNRKILITKIFFRKT